MRIRSDLGESTYEITSCNGFVRSLSESAAWCFHDDRDRTFGRLRSPELRPEIDTFPEPGELRTAVAGVVKKRRTLLGDIPLEKPGEVNRVLICEYNMSLSSGESESVSNGFFDIHDHPPWDTWIAYSKAPPAGAYPDGLPLVISYVPHRHQERVAAAISANPYECVYWGELIP